VYTGVRGWAWVKRNQVDKGHTPVSWVRFGHVSVCQVEFGLCSCMLDWS
jgi:hypothetical protein